MSLTVRYPDGMAVTYNAANHLVYQGSAWKLYTRAGGQWVASIQASAGAVIEAERHCSVVAFNGSATEMLRYIRDNMREFDGGSNCALLANIKRELRDFDARTGEWR